MRPRISFAQVQELQQQLKQEQMRKESQFQKDDMQYIENENDDNCQTQEQQLEKIKRICNNLSQEFSFSKLYQWQREVVQIVFKDFLSNKRSQCFRNHVLNVSTASGKTHVITIFVLASLLRLRKSVIIVVPYIALVDELVARFRNVLKSNSGCGLASITGLQPLPGFINQRPTLYIVTIEKANPLIRNMIQGYTIHKLGLIVVDEVHVIGEPTSDRGAKLELLLTYLKHVQIILSRQNGLQEMYQAVSDQLVYGMVLQQGRKFKMEYLQRNFAAKSDGKEKMDENSKKSQYQQNKNQGDIEAHITIKNISDILVGEVPNDVKYQLQKLEIALNEIDNQQQISQTINYGIMCLSATLDNADEFGKWLNAHVHTSTFRQSPLKERLCFNNKLYEFSGLKSGKSLGNIPIHSSIKGKILTQLATVSTKPLLVFCGTKKECSIFAHQFKEGLIAMNLVQRMQLDEINQKISNIELKEDENIVQALDGISSDEKESYFVQSENQKDIQNQIKEEGPFGESVKRMRISLIHKLTYTGKRYLAELFMYGIGFHNSDLLQSDRQLVEEGFRTRILHTIFATTTLAAGVNLPATTVIISGIRLGNTILDAQHYKQMIGRAGRYAGVQGISILVMQQNDLQLFKMTASDLIDSIQQKYQCKSQLFTENSKTSSFNTLLMMASELKDNFHEIYKNTLYFVQNKNQIKEIITSEENLNNEHILEDTTNSIQQSLNQNNQALLEDCIENLIQTKILNRNKESGRLLLTKYGKAINDANIPIQKSYYYFQLIDQINMQGIDVEYDDIVLLLLTQQYDIVYQAFRPGTSFKENLDKDVELKSVSYDNILSLSHLCLQFLEISHTEVSSLSLISSSRYKVKYCIASRLCELKKQIFAVENGNQDFSDELLKGAVSLAGQLSIFLGLQAFNNLKSLIQLQQTRIRQLLQDDITELLQIRNVGVFRARILKQAGFHNAIQIVNEGVDKLRLLVNFGGASEAAVQRVFDGAKEVVQKGWGDPQTIQ